MKNNKLKIAFIVNREPSLESGGEVRNFYILQALTRVFDVKIYVPTFSRIPFIDAFGEVKPLYKLLFVLFGKIPYVEKLRKAKFNKKEINEIKNADIVQIQELESYFTIENFINEVKGKIVLDTHNIDYIRFRAETESKNLIEKYLGRFLSHRLKQIEINAIKKCEHILVCSELEKKYFAQYINAKAISVIPNGADTEENYSNEKVIGNSILFMGLLGYRPNAEGLKYYIENIHPKVIKRIPTAQLIILGKNAPSWLAVMAKNNPNITLVGFVKDVREYIAKTAICICPLLSGSGTRLKILEYMAMGKPVISTSIGAEGIQIKDGKDILLADSPELFFQKIIEVLNNKKYADQLGINAKKTIKENYEWNIIMKELVAIYKSTLL